MRNSTSVPVSSSCYSNIQFSRCSVGERKTNCLKRIGFYRTPTPLQPGDGKMLFGNHRNFKKVEFFRKKSGFIENQTSKRTYKMNINTLDNFPAEHEMRYEGLLQLSLSEYQESLQYLPVSSVPDNTSGQLLSVSQLIWRK